MLLIKKNTLMTEKDLHLSRLQIGALNYLKLQASATTMDKKYHYTS